MKVTIIVLIIIIAVIIIASLVMRQRMLKGQNHIWKLFMKNDGIIRALDSWMDLRERGLSIESIIKDNGYDSVAIYGFGVLGRRLYKELQGGNIKIDYIVDKKLCGQGDGVTIVSPDNDLPETELLIITAIGDYLAIRKSMKKKLDCPIISFEDVVYGN